MKKASKSKKREPVPDIDFSGGVRGKYAARFAEGTNLVALSPDVAEVFPDSASVNEALRTLVKHLRQDRSSCKVAEKRWLTPRSSCGGPALARQPSCLEQRKFEPSRIRHAEPAARLNA